MRKKLINTYTIIHHMDFITLNLDYNGKLGVWSDTAGTINEFLDSIRMQTLINLDNEI